MILQSLSRIYNRLNLIIKINKQISNSLPKNKPILINKNMMNPQYKQLSQQQLRNLYSTRGVILLLDIPQGLQFGIDNIVWKIGNKFKGIKFIPFGCHIISYSLKDQNHMFKINKFIYFDTSKQLQTQYIILKWSFKYHMFLELKGSQAQGYRQGIKNYHFDSYLGLYPQSNYQFWKQNTNYITRGVLQKLDPVQKIYKFEQEYNKIKEQKQEQLKIDQDQNDQQEIEEINQNQLNKYQNQFNKQSNEEENNQANQQRKSKPKFINKKFQTLSDTIYYSEIPRVLFNDPNHINKINLNKTQIFLQVLLKQYFNQSHNNSLNLNSKNNKLNSKDALLILGQIQYSFIYFLIGQDEDSLHQWKKLIHLVSHSQDIFQTKQMIQFKKQQLSNGNSIKNFIVDNFQQIALQFIVVLYNQIKQFPADFFIDELSKNNFMQSCLKRLKQYKDEQEGQISKKVKKRLQKLFKLLSDKFNYNLQEQQSHQQNQDAPVIVSAQQNYF